MFEKQCWEERPEHGPTSANAQTASALNTHQSRLSPPEQASVTSVFSESRRRDLGPQWSKSVPSRVG